MIKIKYHHLCSDVKEYWGTDCRIIVDGLELVNGLALLSPKDQFSRRVGRAVSFYKALKQIENKNLRKRVCELVDPLFLKTGRELVRNA